MMVVLTIPIVRLLMSAKNRSDINVIKLSRNFGKESALRAGH